MDYQLVIVRGRSGSETINLADGITSVGRHDDCQLRIKSSQVSRRHCELFEKKGLLVIKDLGSSNGTYVNGKRVEGQRVLESGDELTIGQVKLRVAKVGESAPPAKVGSPSKPGDTAIVEPVTTAASEDDFEIEFDEELTESDPVTTAEMDEPETAITNAPQKSPRTEDPKNTPKVEQVMADEAVADFLLDIKLDEEE